MTPGEDLGTVRPLSLPERTRLLHGLTGGRQEWLRLCSGTVPDRPVHLAELLQSGSEIRQALDAGRRWRTGSAASDPEIDDLPTSATVSAARAIAGVARGMCVDEDRALAVRAASAHWTRACLPAFDSGAPLPDAMVLAATGAARTMLSGIDEIASVSHRGFLALLVAELLGRPLPTSRSVSLPVLFDRHSGHGSGQLHLRVLESGPSGFHPDPANMCFFVGDERFVESVRRAWEHSREKDLGECVCWSVVDGESPCNSIEQGSLGAAFAVGLRELHRLRRRRGRISPRRLSGQSAITGALDATAENLVSVSGYVEKFKAAQEAALRLVVVPRPARTDLPLPPPPDGVRVEPVATLEQAVARLRKSTNPRFVATVAAALAVVIVAVTISTWALARARDSNHRAALAQLSTVSGRLRAEADAIAADDPDRALRIALAAHNLDDNPATAATLVNILATTGYGAPSTAPAKPCT
jgi:hypothetical protein